MTDTPLFSPSSLQTFAAAVLTSYRVPEDEAELVAESLVAANLRGVDTHGVARLPSYTERLARNLVNPRPRITVTSRMPWAAQVDGDNGMGAVVASRAIHEALERANRMGVGGAVARGSNHFGTAAHYALQAVKRDCVGIVLSPASKSLAPFGSREPLLGTNPFAVAIPAGDRAPWVMDMASSVAARGHIRLAARQGKSIPSGWALDAEGNPTTDATKALSGVMVPFAGPKGSAIAMMVDILGGVLAGSEFAGGIRDMNFDFEAPQNVGHFFLAFKIESFMAANEFYDRMDTVIQRLKALKPAAGFDEVLYPGEPEARKEAARWAEGIPLTADVVAGLRKLSEERGIPFEASAAPTSEAAAR